MMKIEKTSKKLLLMPALCMLLAFTSSSCKKEVESVTLNKTTLSLVVGASETLTATVTPSNAEHDALAWTSSNAAVATVDNSGKVTAVTTGTATITVSVAGKSATCAVTVSQSSGTTTYRVGDLYNVGGVKGIVFAVSADKKHGSILAIESITSAQHQWATVEEVTGATDTLDGSVNMAAIKTMPNWQTNYPAFNYWDDKGFYIPAKEEIRTICKNYTTIKAAVESNGGIFNFLNANSIYSSTEVSKEKCLECFYNNSTVFIESNKVIQASQAFSLGVRKF